MKKIQIFRNGLIENNPVFAQLLGMCPALATTTNAENALGMGLASTSVLVMSNLVVSLIKKLVPEKIRIPVYIVVIASFVTIIDLLMHGFTYELWKTLGLFIPLIVVNCMIMGRAESFASKSSPLDSIVDAFGIGFGFTGALVLLGSVRELLGNGSIFGFDLWGDTIKMYAFILPPGAFITLGMLLAMFNYIGIKKTQKEKSSKGAKK